ncbi:MAG: NUDIX domain-containing protein [bacterium]|nr:NUDIX domain-containing protein [bacterium]
MHLPKNSIIASGPVIIENGKVLLNKHGKDNFWKFPGGEVEDFGKSLEAAAKREVKEELGIGIEIMFPLKPIMIKKDGRVVVLIHWLAKRKGEIKLGKDIREWAWLDIKKLPKDCAPNVKEIVKDLLKCSCGCK